MLPRMITTLLPRRCNHAANRKKLASRVALLACRGGVRTFAAAFGWRTSLACFVGTLAAVPGCNGDAGASRIAFRAALACWRFGFQAVIEFFGFRCTHHSHVGNVRSA